MESPWIQDGRGCRQGDPLSPYIFLLCAEIIAILVKQSKDIKGLTIIGKDYLIALYADDIELLLDGSKGSFEATIDTLDIFANISGLRINFDKTQIIWIGSKKNSNIKFRPD